MKRLSTFIIAGIIICVLILLVGVLVVVFGKMDRTVEARGSVQPAVSVDIAPRLTGIVEEVRVRHGQSVQEGDTLLILASGEIEYEVEHARQQLDASQARLKELQDEYHNLTASGSYETSASIADLTAAQEQLEIAKARYERSRQLWDQNMISLDDMEQIELNYKVRESNYRILKERHAMLKRQYQIGIGEAERSIELARQAVTLAEQRLDNTVLLSRASGVVLTMNVEQLEGSRVIEGEEIIRVGDFSSMNFLAGVSENDIHKISVGHEAKIFINAFPHREYKVFSGEVTEISTAPSNGTPVVTYASTISIDEPWVDVDGTRTDLKPGLSGRVEIVVEKNVRLIDLILDSE